MPPRCRLVDQHHLHPFFAERGDQRIMLRLLFGKAWNHLPPPIGACLGVTIGTKFRDQWQAFQHTHFLARAMHQHHAQAPDIGIAAPTAAPAEFLF